jgi:LacI family transcriptional regulator
MKHKITIKEIAEQLSVSITSVSVALNGKARQHGLSLIQEKRIMEYCKKVGYRANSAAASLRTGKSKMIGLLIENIADPFFSGITQVIEKLAYGYGYQLIVGCTENNRERTVELLRSFREHNVDGYIIAPPQGINYEVRSLIKSGFPVVLFDRTIPGINCCKVMIDNFNGVSKAMEHLVANKFKYIVMVTLKSEQDQIRNRNNGYLSVMKQHNLPVAIERIDLGEDKLKSVEIIKKFLLYHQHIDAVFFSTNFVGNIGLKAVKDYAIQTGRNIGVVVFDDDDNFDLLKPSITSIAQPIEEIGKHVIEQLICMLLNANGSKVCGYTVLNTKLVKRESSDVAFFSKNGISPGIL